MNAVFDELRLTGNLPSPSGVGLAILDLTQRDDFSAEQLAQTIQTDPALTGRIIKLANSVVAGGVKPVATVAEAVVRLGTAAVRNCALGFSLISSHRAGKCAGFDFNRFWSESLARAIAAQESASAFSLAPPAEAYVCGLLASIGKLALATVHPRAYSEVLLACTGPDDDALVRAERERFGIDHRAVAAEMLADWRLPDAQREAIAGTGDVARGSAASKLRRVLAIAGPLAAIFASPPREHAHHLKRLENPRGDRHDFDLERLASVADRSAKQWQEWAETLALPFTRLPPFAELRQTISTAPPPAPATAAKEAGAPNSPNAKRSPGIDTPPSFDTMFERWHSEELPRDGILVLVADDDPVSRRIVVTHLQRSGYRVIDAKDGREALAKALEHNPHIVITDWQMPELDGVTVCARLRDTDLGRKMYVLVLTGADDEEHTVRAFDAGADDYVTKPINPRVLLARVGAGERLARLQDRVEKDHQRLQDHLAHLGILNRKLRFAAVTDALTNLPNRRFAMRLVEELWAKEPARVAVIAIDIDHFKRINDEHGHDSGDFVLRHVAQALARGVRPSDRVCRVGGEEFLVICPDCPASAAAKVAERLRAAVNGARIKVGSRELTVTISAGVAERTSAMSLNHELLKNADEALYAAKRAGRNRVTVHPAA